MIKITKKQLYNLYWNKKLSQVKIGKLFNKSQGFIFNYMKKFKIKSRSKEERQSGVYNGNWKHGKYDTNIDKKCEICGKKLSSGIVKRCNKHKLISIETRKKMSLNHANVSGSNNPMFGKITHGKWEKYKNIWMRSSYEVKYAKYLDKNNIKWEYEPKTFDLGNTTYTPDFYLPETDEYIEIKGYWREDAKNKFNLCKKLYSHINIKIYDNNELKKIGIL